MNKEAVSNKEKKINKEEKSDRKKERNIVKNLREKVTDFHSFGNFSQVKEKQNFTENYKSDYKNVKEADRNSCLEKNEKNNFGMEKKKINAKETEIKEDKFITKQENEEKNEKLDLISDKEEKNKAEASQQHNNTTKVSDKKIVHEEGKSTKNNLDSFIDKVITVEQDNHSKIIEKLEKDVQLDNKNNTKDFNQNREKLNEEIKNDNKNFKENKLLRSDVKSEEIIYKIPTDIKDSLENVNIDIKTSPTKENIIEGKTKDNLNELILEKEENPSSQQIQVQNPNSQQNKIEIDTNSEINKEIIENHQACPESHETKPNKVESKFENCNIIENSSLDSESQKPNKGIKLDEKDHSIKAETCNKDPISLEVDKQLPSNEKKEEKPRKSEISKERESVKKSEDETNTPLEPSLTDAKSGSKYYLLLDEKIEHKTNSDYSHMSTEKNSVYKDSNKHPKTEVQLVVIPQDLEEDEGKEN